jgi:hypothetical protein
MAEEPWLEDLWSRVTEWSRASARKLCTRFLPVLQDFDSFSSFCAREIDYQFERSKPKSKYRKLLSQRRIRRLRAIMPKRFRSPQPKQLSRSVFVLSIFGLLEALKKEALQSNITITSATISRAGWVRNEMGDLINEACLLADIEVFEQPHDRLEAAARTEPGKKSVLVLDHGSTIWILPALNGFPAREQLY